MDHIEPYRQIVQLQAQIVKISERNLQLKQKCEELEEELAVQVLGSARSKRGRVARRTGSVARKQWSRLRAGLEKRLGALKVPLGVRV